MPRLIIRFIALILSMLTVWSDAQSERICEDGKRSYFGVCPEGDAKRPPGGVLPIPTKEPEMVAIPGGCFQMGDPASEPDRSEDERQHQVCVQAFEIGRYEVTQRQWQAVMGNNPSYFSGCADCPVERVTVDDIRDYLVKLNRRTGKTWRLPTEAEWEYACRGGAAGQTYCGGDSPDRLAWYDGNSGSETHPVGQKAANGFGLYDMSGNVWEWTCSDYDKDYGGSEKKCTNNTVGPLAVRGGGWEDRSVWVRSANRNWVDPVLPINDFLGFRLARSL